MGTPVSEARLGAGLACLRVGTGPPLLFLPGLTAHHRLPHGADKLFQLSQVRPYARTREVWWLQRREGLPTGTTMAAIADDYADVARRVFDEPVDVVGSSTGGSVALQLTADHPGLVRRLVLLSSACRLGPAGKEAQRRVAELSRENRPRGAGAQMLSMLGGGRGSRALLGSLGWLAAPLLVGDPDPDMLATIDAEDGFDLTDRLPSIATPTLVVGGGRDPFYGADVFEQTAAGLPRGRLLLHPDKGHGDAQTSRVTTREVLSFLAG